MEPSLAGGLNQDSLPGHEAKYRHVTALVTAKLLARNRCLVQLLLTNEVMAIGGHRRGLLEPQLAN